MNALGTQILLELKGCDQHLLNDLAYVRQALIQAAREVGVNIVGEAFYRFDPQGVTGILAIAESHLSIHTWPEYGYAAVDVFTCGEPEQALKASEILIRLFKALDHSRIELKRGPLSQPAAAARAQT